MNVSSYCIVLCIYFILQTLLDDLGLLIKGIETVLEDDGFQISTEKAASACLAARRLLEWVKNNEEAATLFASTITEKVRECCTHSRAVTCHTFKERMWGKFYQLCSSDNFRNSWTVFLESSIGLKSVIFYQFVTKAIFHQIIEMQLPVEPVSVNTVTPAATASPPKLDKEESNALRYCIGYVLRSTRKKIEKSANRMKQQLLLCIEDLFESKSLIEFSDQQRY